MHFLLFTDVVLKKWSNELREKIIALLLTAVLMITACGAKETMQDAADTSSSVNEAATEESTKDSAEDANDPNLLLEYGPGLEKGLYSGHTWKEYFLYYDKDKADFVEYATKELTEEKLADACGFDLAGEIKAEGFTLGHIYRRDNGIININYCMRTDNANGSVLIEYKNATYNEKTKSFMYDGGEGEKPWQKSDCGGIFLANI